MRIQKDAVAGTLESSDVMVKVSPNPTLEVNLTSTVMAQFGDQIRKVIDETLEQLGVTSGSFVVEDKGALDCTIKARIQGAVARASEDKMDWSLL